MTHSTRTLTIVFAAFVAACHHGAAGSTQTSPAKDTATTGISNPSDREQVQDASQLIQGRFPGVDVQPLVNGGYTFVIRGRGTLVGGGDPLIIVDNTPVTGSLSWLNPNDIAHIDVLKNPDQTAIYGLRGSNGVIVITTKHSH
jgi:TonB-dependent SusC/RagA subfamily outer membrane receptor